MDSGLVCNYMGYAKKTLRFAYLTRGTVGVGGVSNDTAERLWRSISSTCERRGIKLITLVGDLPGQNQNQVIFQEIQDGYVDGIISWSSLGELEKGHDLSRFVQTPIVVLSRKVNGRPTISIDNHQGIHYIASHLVEVHGFRNIAFIRGPQNHPYSVARWDAYRQILANYSIPYDKNLVTPWGSWDKSTGRNAIEILLKNRKLSIGSDIQAIMCANDRIAIGVIEELSLMGYRCPEDVAVTGFNHLPESDKIEPALTTVHMPFELQAQKAVDLLIEMINQQHMSAPDIVLDSTCLFRDSCGCKQYHPKIKLENNTILLDLNTNANKSNLLPELQRSFNSALISKDESLFFDSIEQLITHQHGHTIECVIHDELAKLGSRFIARDLHDEEMKFAEYLIHGAYFHVFTTQIRSRNTQDITTFIQRELLQKIDFAFSLETDQLTLYQKLQELMPKIGINSFYLVMYEPNMKSRLEFGFSTNTIISEKDYSEHFSRDVLLPASIFEKDTMDNYLVRTLFFRSRVFGHLVFAVGPLDGTLYDSITYKLSAIINNQILSSDLEDKVNKLLTANNKLSKSLEELRDTQKQLVESQKMAALGELVVGVSHELNTPLGVALTASSYLQMELQNFRRLIEFQQRPDVFKAVELVMNNIQRANNLINHFQSTIQKPSDLEIVPFQLSSLFDEVSISNKKLMKDIDISIECLVDTTIEIVGPKSVYFDIVNQLVQNSISHGFPDGKKGRIQLVGMESPTHIILKVVDTGIGISEDNKDKIFNPFYTTGRGKGHIGLGLHGLFNTVTQVLSGSIQCHSSGSKGTTFEIGIPKKYLDFDGT
jgi:DNA-binding LacI/PurR family transcriptional regulator/signal transduction histidine kinase